ncbi:MAG: hypothetical protein ACYDCC_13970 [Actinomycetota bacterium]
MTSQKEQQPRFRSLERRFLGAIMRIVALLAERRVAQRFASKQADRND